MKGGRTTEGTEMGRVGVMEFKEPLRTLRRLDFAILELWVTAFVLMNTSLS